MRVWDAVSGSTEQTLVTDKSVEKWYISVIYRWPIKLVGASRRPILEGGTCMPIRNLTVNHHWLARERPKGVSARPHPIHPVSPVKESLSVWNRGRNVDHSPHVKEYKRRIPPEILGKLVGRTQTLPMRRMKNGSKWNSSWVMSEVEVLHAQVIRKARRSHQRSLVRN